MAKREAVPADRGGPRRPSNGWCGSIVIRLVWGGVAALALGLTGCGGDQGPLVAPEPGGGFKAEVQETVAGRLTLPEQISADAALIQAEAVLANRSDDVVVLTVPRACDVQDWVIRDAAGKLLMAKGPVECVDQPVTKAMPPGSFLRERVYLYLMPRVLEAGKKYSVEYRFWGQPARADFTTLR